MIDQADKSWLKDTLAHDIKVRDSIDSSLTQIMASLATLIVSVIVVMSLFWIYPA
jgi:hypothetical protein